MSARPNAPTEALAKLAAACSLAGLMVWAAAVNPARAQDITIPGRSFELTFVERQGGMPPAVQSPASIPGIVVEQNKVARQDGRVALTFRSGYQVDYEHERNPSSINATAHSYRSASGPMDEWLRVPNPGSSNVHVRISARANKILAEVHGRNFTQVFRITTDGSTCSAEISYVLDAGQKYFKMANMKTKLPTEHAALAADNIRCALGTANIY